MTELFLSQNQNRRVADFSDRKQQRRLFMLTAIPRLLVNLIFDKVPNPIYFNVTGVRAQPDVGAFFSCGFRFTAFSPPWFSVTPAEQSGSWINVKPVDRH